MQVHRLLGALRGAWPRRAAWPTLGLAAPLVGRDAELAQLLAAFDRMQRGQAQLVSVVGRGRRRQVAPARRVVRAARGATAGSRRPACAAPPARRSASRPTAPSARCSARPTASSRPIRWRWRGTSCSRACAPSAPTRTRPMRSRRCSATCSGVEEARPRDIEPEQLQRQITLAARTLLERRLAQQPLLIVVDDLQWADAASVDLLREVRRPAGGPAADAAGLAAPRRAPRCSARAPRTRVIELGPLARRGHARAGGATCSARRPTTAWRRCAISSRRAPAATRCSSRRSCAAWSAAACCVREDERWVCERRLRRAGCAVHAVRPAAVAHRPAGRRRPPARCRRRRCWARSSTARCCSASRATPRPTDAALDAARRRPICSGRTRARRASASASPTRWCTRWPTRTCCWRVAPSCTSGAGAARSEAQPGRRRPQPAPAERPGGARPPLEPVARTRRAGARYLLAAGDWARAVYANDDAIRHYERALRTLAERRTGRATSRARARRARAAGRPARPAPGGATRRWRTTTPCCGRSRPARSGAARRACCARSAACTGRPASASAPAPASAPGLERLGRRTATRSSAPTCSRRWAGSPFAPATTPAAVALGRARAGRRRARGAGRRRPRARARGRRRARRRPTTRSASRWRAWAARPRRWSRSSAASPWPRRATCCRPPAAATPTSACCTRARSAAQHRDLPARARDREEGRRPRLPVAPVRQPGGGLLRADQPLRGRGHRGGAARPSTSTAGSACSITWRCR